MKPELTIPQYVKPEPTVPSAYVMHCATTHCTNCGTESHSTQFYALSFIRSRFDNKPVRKLDPVTRATYNLPVERVLLARQSTPFCSACPSIDLSHLPEPPSASRVSTMIEPQRAGPTKPAPKPKPSIFDLA